MNKLIRDKSKKLKSAAVPYQTTQVVSPTAVHEIVKPMTRGQITLPKEVREQMGIDENTWLWVDYDGGDEIKITKVQDPQQLEMQQMRENLLKTMEELEAKYKDGPPLWTEEDDAALKKSREISKRLAKERSNLW